MFNKTQSNSTNSSSLVILGILIVLAVAVTCFINGDQNGKANVTELPRSMEETETRFSNSILGDSQEKEKEQHAEILPLTSQLGSNYLESADESEVEASSATENSKLHSLFNKHSRNNSENLIMEEAALTETFSGQSLLQYEQGQESYPKLLSEQTEIESSTTNNNNMLHVLEYERLKRFLRRLSTNTIRKLRKLLMWNPEEGQRYLVQLARNANEQNRVHQRNSGGINRYVDEYGQINHKDLVKIATVIFEPEFLELANFDKTDSSNENFRINTNVINKAKTRLPNRGSNNNRLPHNSFKIRNEKKEVYPSHFYGQELKENWPQHLTLPSPPKMIHHSPVDVSDSVNLINANKGTKYRLSLKAKIKNHQSSSDLPLQFQSENLQPYELETFDGPSTYPKLYLHPPPLKSFHKAENNNLKEFSSNNQNFKHSSASSNIQFKTGKKPMVEFVQIVNPHKSKPSNLQDLPIMAGSEQNMSSTADNSKGHPVSFYISSILADTNDKLQQINRLSQQKEMMSGNNNDNQYEDLLQQESAGSMEFVPSSFTIDDNYNTNFGHKPYSQYIGEVAYESPFADLAGSSFSKRGNGVNFGGYSTNSHSSPGDVFSMYSPHGFNSNSGMIVGESPYNNLYKQYPSFPPNSGSSYTSSSYPGYSNAHYGNFAPAVYSQQQHSSGTFPGHEVGSFVGSYPFEHSYKSGPTILNMQNGYGLSLQNALAGHGSNGGVENSYHGWFDTAKSILDSISSGYYNNSAGTRKVLEISISVLAFLAFGSYVSTLLLRAIAPSLLNPSLPGLYTLNRNRNRTEVVVGKRTTADSSGNKLYRYESLIADDADYQNSTNSTLLTELEERVKFGIQNFIKSLQ